METMLKLTDDQYNRLYVTSDTHFGHNKEFIYSKRGYNNPQDMNADMIQIINNKVGSDGILLHLGDFCLNTNHQGYVDILRQLAIKELWMIWGNHNNPVRKSYGGTQQQIVASHGDLIIRYFDHYLTMRHGKNFYVCFHFPMLVWDGQSQGSMHLCGHSHGDLPISRPEDTTRKILDCGWDVHGAPLTMNEINIIMNSKGTNSLHHA